MATGKVLLDTNAVIALSRGEPSIKRLVIASGRAFISVVTLGELCYGAERSQRRSENLAVLSAAISRFAVLACTTPTAVEYGRLKQMLAARGKPIPQNDLWIAATAIEYDLLLISRDRHFEGIEGLALAGW
jgi:tRNA(fMet)-specific endonuclease VapC